MVIYYSPDAGCASEPKTPESQLKEQLNQRNSGGDNSDHFVNTSHFTKRPMSFMKALEMADKLERFEGHSPSPKQRQPNLLDTSSSVSNENRQSQYEVNYEISV